MPKTKLFLTLTCILLFVGSMSAATTPTTGTYTINFTLTVASNIPTTADISCSSELEVTGDKVGTIVETAAALATRSGSTATCTVSIPYSWNLESPTTDKLYVLYTIIAPANTTVVYPAPSRTSHLDSPYTTGVPATGTTTTVNVTGTF
jgi:hypothetical protein